MTLQPWIRYWAYSDPASIVGVTALRYMRWMLHVGLEVVLLPMPPVLMDSGPWKKFADYVVPKTWDTFRRQHVNVVCGTPDLWRNHWTNTARNVCIWPYDMVPEWKDFQREIPALRTAVIPAGAGMRSPASDSVELFAKSTVSAALRQYDVVVVPSAEMMTRLVTALSALCVGDRPTTELPTVLVVENDSQLREAILGRIQPCQEELHP